MSRTVDTGVDFIHRIMAEVKVLQEDVGRLSRMYAEVQSGLKTEQSNREGDVSALHARLTQERSADALARGALEKKQEEFEHKTRTWVGSLGKDNMALKDQITVLEKSTSERAATQAAVDDKRFLALEVILPKKGEAADLHKLAIEVGELRKEAERDRNVAAAAVRGAQNAAAADFKTLEDRAVRQSAADDRRFAALEAVLPRKSEADDHRKLADEVAALRKDADALRQDAERDRNVAAAAVRGAQVAAATDFKTLEERAVHQAAADDKRFLAVEALLSKKGEAVDLHRITAEVDDLRKDAERDRNVAAAAVRGAQNAAAADFKTVEERVAKLQDHTEAGRRALVAEICGVSTKLDNVDAFAQTRAKAADLQALEPRVSEAEKSIGEVAFEVKTKAPSATVNSISDRLTGVSMDLQTHGARTQADKEALQESMGKLEKTLTKIDRQADADRERTSNCVVALEKELSNKAAKAETDLIGPKTLSAAMDKIESRALELEKTIHSHKQEVSPLRSRVEALETAFPTRADSAEIPKLHLAIAEQAAKHDSLHSRTQEHGVKLEKVSTDVMRHLSKLESMENRSTIIERQLTTKADATEHFTKDHTSDLFRDYYRREEIDAMLSRVWWRVGDMTKGRTVPGVPITTR